MRMLATICLGVVVLAVAVPAANADKRDLLEYSRTYEMITLDPGQALGEGKVRIVLPLSSGPLELALVPDTPRGKRFTLVVQDDNGYSVVDAPAPATYGGSVVGQAGSKAFAVVRPDTFRGLVMAPNGEQLVIEPAQDFFDNARKEEYLVFRQSDLLPMPPMTCGAGEDQVPAEEPLAPPADQVIPNEVREEVTKRLLGIGDLSSIAPRSANRSTASNVQWAIYDTDYEYFLVNNSDRQDMLDDLELKATVVNDIYRTQADVEYASVLTLLRTTANDPYSTFSITSAVTQELPGIWENAKSVWPRDIVHLYSGKDFGGTTIGYAFISFTAVVDGTPLGFPGVMCRSEFPFSYGASEQQGNAGTLFVAPTIIAHELGHNWGLNHCGSGFSGCCAPGVERIMCAGFNISGLSSPITRTFEAASVSTIVNHVATVCDNRLGDEVPDTPVDTPTAALLLVAALTLGLWWRWHPLQGDEA